MTTLASLKRPLVTTGIYTALLSLVFILFSWKHNTAADIFIALPYFVVLYFMLFSLGKPAVSDWLRKSMKADIRRVFLFPLLLVLLYFSYVGFNKQNPLQGTLFLVPYLLFFPVMAFAARANTNAKLDWLDFSVFVLFFFPVTLIDAKPSGNLPFNGGGFDSVYRITVMLAAVFAFVTVRHIRDVGFYPVFKWKYLFTVVWVWMAFYVFVFIIGWSVDFIKLRNEDAVPVFITSKVARSLLSVFLHTALFEEFVFRGLLQNMLAKRIGQSGSWKTFWIWGLVILTAVSLLTGYALNGTMQWFPALVTVLLCAAAYGMERKGKTTMGVYTALAVTSVIFGLVHAHAGSIIFVGLASIGGWAYGYVYLKTGNVFYAALLHALVNTTPLLFGLELAK
ncbi:CPBP family intramembrane glutamic endopeptidase [Agriterribacter sp.]|uniref:CPBP family intramembrane glutamic endopeptidase n=1 Tax=Agriterribacter sp. TaxID=2821509 RepID=UPI002B7AB0D2|nr:CPBP family intramembrane glutamic endopeptidase [Agriterribacter sp.]HTN06610.1 CPBP family intramembrane glutamic endopeptidase [Agriterribacter sp.]